MQVPRSLLLLILVWVIPALLRGVDSVDTRLEAIPPDSRDLLEKLEQYEQEQSALVEAMIADKREAVAKVLTGHLDQQTRSGNLVEAVALKKTIEALRGQSAGETAAAPLETGENSGNMSGGWMKDTVWQLQRSDGREFNIEIGPDAIKHSNYPKLFPYQPEGADRLEYRSLSHNVVLEFEENMKTGSYQDDGGGTGTLTRVE